ncbi:hypothetical protein RJ55_07667 [Drechmeria coniospora]|nr:hypothetical protein RJ55_07667 [Drechmeria coniospora]
MHATASMQRQACNGKPATAPTSLAAGPGRSTLRSSQAEESRSFSLTNGSSLEQKQVVFSDAPSFSSTHPRSLRRTLVLLDEPSFSSTHPSRRNHNHSAPPPTAVLGPSLATTRVRPLPPLESVPFHHPIPSAPPYAEGNER